MHRVAVVLVALGVALAFGTAAQAQEVTADEVRASFAGLTVAQLEAAGYEAEAIVCIDAGVLPPGVAGLLGIPTTAGMGIHYVNGAFVDDTLDPMEPEAVMFGPDGTLWGVEYLTLPQAEPMELFGQQLSLTEAVGLDALHLWVIDNPGGQFTDFNADVSCGTVEVVDAGSGGLLSASSARGGGALAWLLALGAGAALVGARRLVGRRTDA
jgi:hypothetical protein